MIGLMSSKGHLLGQARRSTTRSGKEFRVAPLGQPILSDFSTTKKFAEANYRGLDGAADGKPDLDFLLASTSSTARPSKRKIPYSALNPTLTAVSAEPKAKPSGTKQSNSNKRRKQRRDNEFEHHGHQIADDVLKKLLEKRGEVVLTELNSSTFRTASGAYNAKPANAANPTASVSLQELLDDGFKLVEWDGRTPRPITDINNVVFAMLAGRPDKPSYEDAVKQAAALMQEATEKTTFGEKYVHTHRGAHASIHTGVSCGMGQPEPMKANGGDHADLIDQLVQSEPFQILASYQDWAFSAFAPRLYLHYNDELQKLYNARPGLRQQRNFRRSNFPCATFNFGRSVSYKHTDPMNVPYGWCGVTSLGPFTPGLGGHLILWDCKMVIQFPAGSVILLPSAVITHSNTTLAAGEQRFSFTQYCAGPLFRWVDAGFQLDEQVRKKSKKRYNEMMDNRMHRWGECIKLLPTLDELSLSAAVAADPNSL